MARIVLSSCIFRYPMGGMVSWLLQYLVGYRSLGHEVTYVEKASQPDDCFDPTTGAMSDECGYGVRSVAGLLERFGFGDSWHFSDVAGRSFGLDEARLREAFAGADLFADMGSGHSWGAHAAESRLRVLIDSEPGFTQMKFARRLASGRPVPAFDRYYTPGRNIGTARSSAPTAGVEWRPIIEPVALELFPVEPAKPEAPYTTVMTWKSFQAREFEGRRYGHKDIEFQKFEELPRHTRVPLEIAVSGQGVPHERLERLGWRVRDANQVTTSFESYADYVRRSRGEFSVCKNCFVETWSGWFGDRAGVYLASGRPVVMQETGWSEYLPCGEGLFAVRSVAEAAAALDELERRYADHARRAREIAEEHLAAEKVLAGFLAELGIR